jgi:hypothetical protein
MPKVVSRKDHASGKENLCNAVAQAKKHLFPNQRCHPEQESMETGLATLRV